MVSGTKETKILIFACYATGYGEKLIIIIGITQMNLILDGIMASHTSRFTLHLGNSYLLQYRNGYMSRVSNVIVTFSAVEQPSRIVDVNLFFVNAGYECGLVSIEDETLPPGWYGGNKPFEAEVLIGAFNFLRTDTFIAHVQAISWEDRASVQVFLQEQTDKRFRIFNF